MSPAGEPFFAGRAGGGARGSLFLIAGPCVLEDDGLNFEIADHIAELCDRLGVAAVFKASFDKANRSSASSGRGPGLSLGLEALRRVRDRCGLPVITDIHLPEQAAEAASGRSRG